MRVRSGFVCFQYRLRGRPAPGHDDGEAGRGARERDVRLARPRLPLRHRRLVTREQSQP